MEQDKRLIINSTTKAILWIAPMYLIFISKAFVPDSLQTYFLIYPHSFENLTGILLSPFWHFDYNHLFSNTSSLLFLIFLLYYFKPHKATILITYSIIFSGTSVWLLARYAYHAGASGILYFIVFYLFMFGILSKNRNLWAISLIMVFLYGSVVWGIVPLDQKISWESHLYGAIFGLLLAYIYREKPKSRINQYLIKYEFNVTIDKQEITYTYLHKDTQVGNVNK